MENVCAVGISSAGGPETHASKTHAYTERSLVVVTYTFLRLPFFCLSDLSLLVCFPQLPWAWRCALSPFTPTAGRSSSTCGIPLGRRSSAGLGTDTSEWTDSVGLLRRVACDGEGGVASTESTVYGSMWWDDVMLASTAAGDHVHKLLGTILNTCQDNITYDRVNNNRVWHCLSSGFRKRGILCVVYILEHRIPLFHPPGTRPHIYPDATYQLYCCVRRLWITRRYRPAGPCCGLSFCPASY